MKQLKKIFFITLLTYTSSSYGCISCNKTMQHAVYESIDPNIFVMLSGFIVLTGLIAALLFLVYKSYIAGQNPSKDYNRIASRPLLFAAIILGIGIGGFIDGIVFHQILQWHQMLSNKLPPDNLLNKNVNMFWDGIFHLYTLTATITGIILLWKLLRKITINTSGYLLSGGLLAGWGLFNLIEGFINHHLLKLHNVREISANKDLWNNGFLIFGLVLLLVGKLLIDKGQNQITTAAK